jgi:predicted chitinase
VAWYGSDKYNSGGQFVATSYNWRNGNLDDPDAQKFRGRGFKQLTGLINYSGYWVYRGWLNKSTFDNSWWTDPHYISKDKGRMSKRPPLINNPHEVTSKPFNCMDSGGWYMSFQRPKVMQEMDSDVLSKSISSVEILREENAIKSVTKAINGGEIGLPRRIIYTKNAKKFIYDNV